MRIMWTTDKQACVPVALPQTPGTLQLFHFDEVRLEINVIYRGGYKLQHWHIYDRMQAYRCFQEKLKKLVEMPSLIYLNCIHFELWLSDGGVNLMEKKRKKKEVHWMYLRRIAFPFE